MSGPNPYSGTMYPFQIPDDMDIVSDILDKRTVYGFGMKVSNGDTKAATTVYVFRKTAIGSDYEVVPIEASGPSPTPRGKPVMAVGNGKLILFGGYDLNNPTKRVEDGA